MSQNAQGFSLKILTINIHKGFTPLNRRFILPELRDAVRDTGADIVLVQEVMGSHDLHAQRVENWPDDPHYEFLADTIWQDFAYGRNAVYSEGDHGNAVLSRLPIAHYENRDISIAGTESRGVLHCQIPLPGSSTVLHVLCVHLGLRESHRREQLEKICQFVNTLPSDAPVVIGGDFNDWRQRANSVLKNQAGMDEVFSQKTGRPARTFPARFPLLRLDRIYVRNTGITHPHSIPLRPWSHLSDHAPLAVEIHL